MTVILTLPYPTLPYPTLPYPTYLPYIVIPLPLPIPTLPTLPTLPTYLTTYRHTYPYPYLPASFFARTKIY